MQLNLNHEFVLTFTNKHLLKIKRVKLQGRGTSNVIQRIWNIVEVSEVHNLCLHKS